MHWRGVSWFVGSVLRIVGFIALASVIVSAVVAEWFGVIAFVCTFVAFYTTGRGLQWVGEKNQDLSLVDSMGVALFTWILTGVIGSIPFLVTAWAIALQVSALGVPPMNQTLQPFLNPLNAVFETTSGFTTTGMTVAINEDALPRTLHWWRSTTEWIGGVGVIVLTLAVLARPGSGSLTLYNSEAREEKIFPSVVSTVKEIWKIYVGFTVVSIVALLLAGMDPWGAINHGMTAVSTGGFSVHDGSIGYYDSAAIEYVLTIIMAGGGIAFPIHYLLVQGDFSKAYNDLQTRWLIGFFAGGTVALTGVLLLGSQYPTLEETFRTALFHFVSAVTTTGFGTATLGTGDAFVWPVGTLVILCIGMFVGGSAGSTASGIKIVRLHMLVKGTIWEIQEALTPSSAVRTFTAGDRELTADEFNNEYKEAVVVTLLWLLSALISVFLLILLLPSMPLTTIVFEATSALSNIGLDAGIIGPNVGPLVKILYMVLMILGRLEVIPVAIVLASLLRRSDMYK